MNEGIYDNMDDTACMQGVIVLYSVFNYLMLLLCVDDRCPAQGPASGLARTLRMARCLRRR